MPKWLSVACVLTVLLVAECRFVGDKCHANNRPGVCRLLSDCEPLLEEIRRNGTPMPGHLRLKLQSLNCGFEADKPIVCCVKDELSTTTDRLSQLFPAPHGFGVPPNGQDVPKPSQGGGNWPWTPPVFTSSTTTSTRRPSFSDDRTNDRTNQNTGNFGSEVARDVSQHRNLRLLPTNCGPIDEDKIFGGNRTGLFEMPWMVLLSYNSDRGTKLSCGGTLIHERYVLTAAHCVAFLGSRLTLSGVILGEHDVRTDPDCERVNGERLCAPEMRNVSIDSVIPHPGYSPQNLFDDIALIRLSERADFSLDSMKPVCLPTTPELQSEDLTGQILAVAGWGATEEGLQSPVLLSVGLPIVSNEDCQLVYKGSPRIYNRQMCAGGVPDKDSCGGDSGGPLLNPGVVGNLGVRYVQRGIVSYGSKRCAIGGLPGVYTRVGHYMDWILDHIRN